MTPEFKFQISFSTGAVIVLGVYFVVYLMVLAYVLNRRRFATNERILWFLVITLVPAMGMVLLMLIGKDDHVRDHEAVGRKPPGSNIEAGQTEDAQS
ncbi:MAG: PLDc N-terminal domain-containing protein [Verrucomicrobiaceae bacterium]